MPALAHMTGEVGSSYWSMGKLFFFTFMEIFCQGSSFDWLTVCVHGPVQERWGGHDIVGSMAGCFGSLVCSAWLRCEVKIHSLNSEFPESCRLHGFFLESSLDDIRKKTCGYLIVSSEAVKQPLHTGSHHLHLEAVGHSPSTTVLQDSSSCGWSCRGTSQDHPGNFSSHIFFQN